MKSTSNRTGMMKHWLYSLGIMILVMLIVAVVYLWRSDNSLINCSSSVRYNIDTPEGEINAVYTQTISFFSNDTGFIRESGIVYSGGRKYVINRTAQLALRREHNDYYAVRFVNTSIGTNDNLPKELYERLWTESQHTTHYWRVTQLPENTFLLRGVNTAFQVCVVQ